MADIYQFVPRQGVAANLNVSGFVDGCKRDLHTFGRELDFDSNQWDVSGHIDRRSKTARVTFTFSTFDTCNSRSRWKPMSEPFLSFAKAKMRYDYSRRPKENHSQKMAALRAMEKALIACSADGVPRVENVDPHVLNMAANILMEGNPGSAYQSGCHLEGIATWLVDRQMVRAPFTWKNITHKPEDFLSKISKEADEKRRENIPPMAALRALPQIFANATDPRDVLVSSIAAVLCCTPGRFNEVFALPAGCEHIDHKPDGKEIYGLRWHTSKRAEPEVRKIIKTMEGICRKAIARLRNVTEEARDMARWYEANPGKLFLPKEFEHLRDQEVVSAGDLAPLLGQGNSSKMCEWAGKQGLEAVKVRPKGGVGAPTNAYRLADVEKVVCGMLPKGFPVFDQNTGMTCGEALLVVPLNFFHDQRGTWRCMFQAVDINTFNNQLGSGAKHGRGSIFSRNNYTDDDGSPIEVDSHDFRHFLTYLGKKKGVDRLILTMWAGRRRILDTDSYGDPSTPEKTQMLRDAGVDVAESLELIGFDVKDPECALMFADAREVLELQYQYVHETRFGYCVHDYDRSPCQRRMQCLECTDHICIKGRSDNLRRKMESVRAELEKSERTLEQVENAIVIGSHDKGSKLHLYLKKRVDLFRGLVSSLDNPELPVGSRVQLTQNAAPTPLDISVTSRISFGDKEGRLLEQAAAALQIAGHGAIALPGAASPAD